jgi:SAM-dependent methyltransferase
MAFMATGTLLRTGRAIATNQVARAFPRLYMRLAGQTGRGGGEATPAETAEYFLTCLDELCAHVGGGRPSFLEGLAGRRVLEYGPGSIPGVALLLLAFGAEKVVCVDRFPLLALSPFLQDTVDEMARRVGGIPGERLRGMARALTAEGIPGTLEIVLHPQGLSGLVEACDLVLSRAVLEEVNDLSATFRDMARALRPGGLAIHQVDLRGYGMQREHPLDFLVPSPVLWHLMFSNKCVPNRVRAGEYRRLARENGLTEYLYEPGLELPPAEVEAVRSRLWKGFRELPTADLACLTFWLCLRKEAAP